MSSSGGGRNPGLTVFGKTHTWYYSLERVGYHCFHPFEVHCRGKWVNLFVFLILKTLIFKRKAVLF